MPGRRPSRSPTRPSTRRQRAASSRKTPQPEKRRASCAPFIVRKRRGEPHVYVFVKEWRLSYERRRRLLLVLERPHRPQRIRCANVGAPAARTPTGAVLHLTLLVARDGDDDGVSRRTLPSTCATGKSHGVRDGEKILEGLGRLERPHGLPYHWIGGIQGPHPPLGVGM